jgi:hypothetical protein
MATGFTGQVVRISSRPFTSKKTGKPGTAFGVVLADENGQEFAPVGGFFDPPQCQVGDKVSLQATENNGYFNVVRNSLSVLAKAAAQTAPAPQQFNATAPQAQTVVAKPIAEQSGRRTNPEDAKRITYQASVSRAIEAVALLLTNKALPISAAASKAAEADRFETVVAAIDKLTVRFYNDAMSLRRLETVADETPSTAADGPLPGAAANDIP